MSVFIVGFWVGLFLGASSVAICLRAHECHAHECDRCRDLGATVLWSPETPSQTWCSCAFGQELAEIDARERWARGMN